MQQARNGLILAPMVRIGTLPARLLAKKYGASVVCTPEIIDLKLSKCKRMVHESGLIDYVHNDRDICLRIHRNERAHLIAQIGSASPQTALAAALLLQEDVAGIDLNCGCPKRFSTHAGMGSALLANPDLLLSILSTLVSGQGLPVSCKIRLLPGDISNTIHLVRRIWATGVSALTVHGRTPKDRYEVSSDWTAIKAIKEMSGDRFVVLSGDVMSILDAERAFMETGCDAVMMARAAQWNLSAFSSCLQSLDQVSREYLLVSHNYGNTTANSKYCLIQAWIHAENGGSYVKRLYQCRSMEDLFRVFDMHFLGDESECKSGEDVEEGYTEEQQQAKLHEQVSRVL